MCFTPSSKRKQKIKLDDGREISPKEMFEEYEKFYRGLRKAGWLPQDARQFLPIGIKSQIVISANFREWRHIFTLRTSRFAHWEIRQIMNNLLKELQNILPGIFDDFILAGKDENNLSYFEKKIE